MAAAILQWAGSMHLAFEWGLVQMPGENCVVSSHNTLHTTLCGSTTGTDMSALTSAMHFAAGARMPG
jgi:hypothetical protein